MKNLLTALTLLLLLMGAAACGPSQPSEEATEEEATEEAAQEEAAEETSPSQPLSPPRTAEGTIGSTSVAIKYSSPSVRDRQIWGSLVPYGQVWRAGANEATTIQFDKNVLVEGKPLDAGSYSIFMIPTENKWTVIFNAETGQWGTNYNESQDVLRVEVTPQAIQEHIEAMEYVVEANGIMLRWEKLAVPVKISESGES